MTDWQTEVTRGCEAKRAMGPRRARQAAQQARAKGEQVSPYRCVFCRSWHLGHVPSMERVTQIAAAIRERAQDPAA